MRTQAAAGIVAVGLSLSTLVACGDDGGPDTTADGITTTTESSDTTAGAATDPSSFAPVSPGAGADGDLLRDGRHFGYITTLSTGPDDTVGEFDLAEILYGEEAAAAARRDGGELEEGADFYISNVNPRLRPVTVDPRARVFDVRYDTQDCCEPVETTLADFVAARDAAREDRTAVNITIDDGVVTEIQEVYFA